MRTFIGPDIILSDLTEGPTLFAAVTVMRVLLFVLHVCLLRV